MLTIIVVTILTFFVIYGPQPLLPLLAETYGVSRPQAALLITVTMFPLSLAPITYGYVLEAVPAARLLRLSVLVLGVTTLAFALANLFPLLVGLRFVQGLLLPAVLTSLMTYLSAWGQGQQMQRVMSVYVAATIAGGYFGRLLSGLSATFFDWHTFFLLLALALLAMVLPLGRLRVQAEIHGARPSPRLLLDALRHPVYLRVYAIIFGMFFIFAGMMNFLPFRLVELWGSPSQLLTGLMYTGYLVGVFTSLGSGWFIERLGGEQPVLRLGIGLYLLVLLATIGVGGWGLFGLLFLFCGAMFLVHATAAGWLNRLAERQKGIVNGLYISAYYGGGVLGSYLPGLLYERFSWTVFILSLAMVACGVLLLAWRMQPGRRPAPV
ncbi:MAG: MFS transporter [Anaerolineae bacterium]